MRKVLSPLLFILFVWFTSCYNETISTDTSIKLRFSTDTVLFDTVFTTIGSATRYFKVYNSSRSDVKIASIRLAGGDASPYRMNVDGEATNYAHEVMLRGKDSLFIFVEVTVNPTSSNSPLFIPDSIVFETNGNVQNVQLAAWGQDVHLLNKAIISESTTFSADKPYLIIDSLLVLPGVELSIDPGVQLHFHNNSLLKVDGSLRVNGLPDKPVVFEGDRLEPFYRDKAGQWGGIWIRVGSHSNHIEWAEIKNAILGVVVDTFKFRNIPSLTIHNTKVMNMSYTALYARGAIIEAGSCLFANAGEITVALTWGGQYRFYHCTIVNYWGQYTSRSGPALLLNNYYTFSPTEGGPTYIETRDMDEAYFGNCIVYGSRSEEFVVDNKYRGQVVDANMNYFFENSILRVGSSFNTSDVAHFSRVLVENPKFKEPFSANFELDKLSPAKDFGLISIANLFPIDLRNVNRLKDFGPDLGAYEIEE